MVAGRQNPAPLCGREVLSFKRQEIEYGLALERRKS
jgi:hypothetical protein